MKKTYDYTHRYRGLWHGGGRCRIAACAPAAGEADRRPVIVATERDDNAGSSVTTMADIWPPSSIGTGNRNKPPAMLRRPQRWGRAAVAARRAPAARGVAPEHVAVHVAERGEARHILGADRRPLGAQPFQRQPLDELPERRVQARATAIGPGLAVAGEPALDRAGRRPLRPRDHRGRHALFQRRAHRLEARPRPRPPRFRERRRAGRRAAPARRHRVPWPPTRSRDGRRRRRVPHPIRSSASCTPTRAYTACPARWSRRRTPHPSRGSRRW